MASSDGTVVLSYDALRKYLPSAPGSKQAALEIVSRAVLCLRLPTWIALVEYRRNPMTGFSMASRYAVRNQPLTFVEACLEDDDYLPLLEQALGHSSATIRQLAQFILGEALRQPEALERLPVAVSERTKRLRGNDDDPDSGGSSGLTLPDGRGPITNRPVEARGGIPKSAQASTATVRNVEKEVLKGSTYVPVKGRSAGVRTGCADSLPATVAGSATGYAVRNPSSSCSVMPTVATISPSKAHGLRVDATGQCRSRRQNNLRCWMMFTCLAGSGSLVPMRKTHIQQLHVYDGQCKAAGMSNMHGLRHRYVQMFCHVLPGYAKIACVILSLRLSHGRTAR